RHTLKTRHKTKHSRANKKHKKKMFNPHLSQKKFIKNNIIHNNIKTELNINIMKKIKNIN
ncbi:hypothetical protein Q5708_15895, partial [Lactiplantibacillus plantarum]|uniref:hypothetical protein n=1 Tax=Lactiplantibacillus plantarum TaxID=1590 RepID=UPI00271D15B1